MKFFENGKLYAGCNYWASHAGIYMWSRWDNEVVDKDFKQLSEIGIELLRVFPLWSDFQPINKVYGYHGHTEGISTDNGETLLNSFDPGIDETMMERFSQLIDLADKYGIKLIPSPLTGWMSGRLFVPHLLEGKNLITDPFAIKWEVRFVKAFVKRFKDRKAIAAWCLGNECNCMSPAESREQAWLWMDIITDAFKSVDPDREVISGMHSQFTPDEDHWTLQDCGDCCDYVTTHPYASPSYATDRDPMNTIKPLLHPTAQTIYSADIAGKPCFIEETGTFGQMYGDEELNAKYCEGAIYSAWSHNCLGYLWWIGYDQGSLTYHPFGYNNRASNYGLYREDRTLKPVGKVLKSFNEFASTFGKLPERIVDGVCIVTPAQNTWNAGGSSFILAKQARLDLRFAYSLDDLPDAKAYFIPSLQSANAFGTNYIKALMNKVENGASLYISLGHGFPRNLTDDFGFHIKGRRNVDKADSVTIGDDSITMKGNVIYDVVLNSAKSLAKNQDGKDVFLKSAYGKGTVYILMYPVESYLYGLLDGYSDKHYKIYDEVKKSIDSGKVVSCDNRMIGVTEHPVSENERIVVLTNYGYDATAQVVLDEGWLLDKVYLGNVTDALLVEIENTKTTVFSIKKR